MASIARNTIRTGTRRRTAPPIIPDLTDEEEAEIQRQIAANPDTWATPADARVLRRGRPDGPLGAPVAMRIDPDVLRALQTPEPEGWEARMNALLRRAMGL